MSPYFVDIMHGWSCNDKGLSTSIHIKSQNHCMTTHTQISTKHGKPCLITIINCISKQTAEFSVTVNVRWTWIHSSFSWFVSTLFESSRRGQIHQCCLCKSKWTVLHVQRTILSYTMSKEFIFSLGGNVLGFCIGATLSNRLSLEAFSPRPSHYVWKFMQDQLRDQLRDFPSVMHSKPLLKRKIVSVHFNNFPFMKICHKLRRHVCMLTYIYLNVDQCWLTSSKTIKCGFWRAIVALKAA